MLFLAPQDSDILQSAKETVMRFTLSIFCAVMVALISIYLIEVEPKQTEGIYFVFAKIVLAGLLSVPVFAFVRLLGEQLSRSWHLFLVLIAIFGIVLYYFGLLDSVDSYISGIIIFKHMFLSLLFVVALLWAPFFKINLTNEDYWEYAKHVIFSWVMAFIFSVIVILGVSVAILAVEKLFSIDINSKLYLQADIIILVLFLAGYFLSQIPKQPQNSSFVNKPPKVEHFFTKWLLMPLSLLYFVILYAYTAKLLVTQEWPKGILAWLIVIFSIIAILTYLFWTHFLNNKYSKWRRWIWLAVLLQAVMLFVAIGMRIAEYSWTESRYMIFMFGVWLVGISTYFLLSRNAHIKWIFVSMSLLLAVSQIGPLSAYNISRKAQETRLSNMVKQLKSYTTPSNAPIKLKYEISNSIKYLYQRYQEDSLRDIFPAIFKAFKKEKTQTVLASNLSKSNHISYSAPIYMPKYITSYLGFKFVNFREYQDMQNGNKVPIEYSVKSYSKNYKTIKPLMVTGYDYAIHISKYGYEMHDSKNRLKSISWSYNKPAVSITYNKEFKLLITFDNKLVTFDILGLFKKLYSKHNRSSAKITQEELMLQKTSSNLRVKLVLTHLGREKGAREIIYFSGILLLGK